jgi:predicted Abi (CAAX) family protease
VATVPSGQDLLITWALFCGYCLVTIPSGLVNTFVNFEPIQVWWSLALYRSGLKLRNNRQAIKLMIMLLAWIILEELIWRVCLVPLRSETMNIQIRGSWIGAAWLVASIRYLIGYRHRHPWFKQRRFLILATLLELVCILAYVLTASLWLTVLLHWLIVIIWLLPLGGQYQLQQHKFWGQHHPDIPPYVKE